MHLYIKSRGNTTGEIGHSLVTDSLNFTALSVKNRELNSMKFFLSFSIEIHI